jgi:hypothetical protein
LPENAFRPLLPVTQALRSPILFFPRDISRTRFPESLAAALTLCCGSLMDCCRVLLPFHDFYVPYFITVKHRCQSFFCAARDFQRDLQENGRQRWKLTTEFTMSFAKDDETEERLLQKLYDNTVKYFVQKGEQPDTIQ